ncbi:ATP-binding protein [Nitrospirillum sp. BR 11163]|uniref:ATP-binding protein n=1 Tax=Nitrospirillum sp. BR 11163 TaxID=3104323 RepID=UPI002AFE18C8|nr:ATP-binding protein [Nitrospirillum sp. BR 11163]MEA1675379.1 ATP-binding protein [Nitrospirillum sp. BR 11163]
MIERREITQKELNNIMMEDEGHFFDIKGKSIQPSKLQETFIAFANADGGDIYVGIEDKKFSGERLLPFSSMEEANGVIATLLEQTVPSVENVSIEFLIPPAGGYILHVSIPKSPKVHYTAGGECFIRLNAQKLKIKGERVTSLAYSKGATPYERVPVDSVTIDEISESEILNNYMSRIETNMEKSTFLRKQRLLSEKDTTLKPNVGCVLLFDENPQATVETRCAVKVYRLRTTEKDYKREHLPEMPSTISGSIEQIILKTIEKVRELVDGASFYDGDKLVTLSYPAEAIKELLVNAVIHRDYSLNDDIHVKVYDNRVEITSPGKLPGYVTKDNLYDERFSRNPNIVRLLHNLPNPLNHDIGEGLDTVRNELKKAGLVNPEFEERGNSFVAIIKHQRIASIEDVILEYIETNPEAIITNKLIRQLSGEDDINKVKKALQKLRGEGKLILVDNGVRAFNYKYKKA